MFKRKTDPLAILPHSGPMRWVKGVRKLSADRITADVFLPEIYAGIYPAPSAVLGIEMLAQAAAILAYESSLKKDLDEPAAGGGRLLRIRDLVLVQSTLEPNFEAVAEVTLEARVHTGVILCQGQLYAGDTIILSAQLLIAAPE